MLSRALTLDERIRTSELFPRIRDAEREMIQNEIEFKKKRERQRKQRQKQHDLDLKELAMKEKAPIVQENHYFTGFVINKDPLCSKYMPFDTVYFPKLFNKTTAKAPPETLQNLWMLGFEDVAQRERQPKEAFVQAVSEMDISTQASSVEKKSKKKKNNKHKFIAIYSQKPVV